MSPGSDRAPKPPRSDAGNRQAVAETSLQFLKANRSLLTYILCVYTVFFLFVFWKTLLAIPSVITGDAVVSSDELVPIFDFHSQFFDQLMGYFSNLTNGFEFRLRYAVLTTWTRYYIFLPFAVFAQPVIASFFMCLGMSVFTRRCIPSVPSAVVIRASALVSLFIELVILYSKFNNFYTLTFGFCIYLVALLISLYAFLFATHGHLRLFVAASILTFFNPSVHYVVLYLFSLLVSSFFIACLSRYEFSSYVRGGLFSAVTTPGRLVLAWLVHIILLIIPYFLFIKLFVLSGINDLADTAPATYAIVEDNSVSLLRLMAFDMPSVMNNLIFGAFSMDVRYRDIFYFAILLLPVFPPVYRSLRKWGMPKNPLILMYLLLVFFMWCSLGYSGPSYVPTFHRVLSWTSSFLLSTHLDLSALAIKIINQFLGVLRFAHRFQLGMFAAAMVPMAMGIAWLEMGVRGWAARANGRWPFLLKIVPAVVCILFFLPFFSYQEYRQTFFSGDFAGAFTPYPLDRLRQVRDILDGLPQGKTMVVPLAQTTSRVVSENRTIHKLSDKFYIYYLNKPNFYYAQTGDISNIAVFSLLYASLYQNQDWWLTVLRDQKVRYVVFNKEIMPNPVVQASVYQKGAEMNLRKKMDDNPSVFKNIFENDGFVLYELPPQFYVRAPADINVDIPWNAFTSLLRENMDQRRFNLRKFPMPSSAAGTGTIVYTDNRKKAELDLYLKQNKRYFTRPDPSTMIFDEFQLPSSAFFSTIYSLISLFQPKNAAHMVFPGIFDTLAGNFLAMPEKTDIFFTLNVPAAGDYEVFLRAMGTANTLEYSLASDGVLHRRIIDGTGSGTVYVHNRQFYTDVLQVDMSSLSDQNISELVPESIVPVANNYTYFSLGTLWLQAGKQTLFLSKKDSNPFILEGAAFVNVNQLGLWKQQNSGSILDISALRTKLAP